MTLKRKLHHLVKEFLDAELDEYIDSPMTCLIDAAQICEGIQETGGNNKGPLVEAFQYAVGKAEGESWCLSFLQALVAYVEDRFNVTCDMPVTEHCMTLWKLAPKKFKFTEAEPQPGDIIVWQYLNTTNGHCGLIIKQSFKVMETIEGNTSMGAVIERDGQGVNKKFQTKLGTPHKPTVGFVRIEFTKNS